MYLECTYNDYADGNRRLDLSGPTTTYEGDNPTFTCESPSELNPQDDFQWEYNGMPLEDQNITNVHVRPLKRELRVQSLEISNITRAQNGTALRCRTNTGSRISSDVIVILGQGTYI